MRHVPTFILNQCENDITTGSFPGTVLFFDVADFTDLSDTFRKEGKKGAEALSRFMRDVLTTPIDLVEHYGGFVSLFAGDAFCALFPEGSPANVKAAVDGITTFFAGHGPFETEIGTQLVSVRLTVSRGEIHWRIFRNPWQNEYIFYGEPLREMVELSHGKAPVALSEAVNASFDKPGNTAPVEMHLDAPFTSTTKESFLHTRLRGMTPDNEIRDGAYCFADLTRIPENDREAALNAIHAKLDAYGGLLNKLDATDKGLVALILFGLPKAVGNTLDRLCRFALEVVEQAPQLSFGLSCGNTFAGYVGSDDTREYTVLGATVNLAARLMGKAQPGEIRTDDFIYRELRYRYAFEEGDPVTLKGFAEPVVTHRLLHRLLSEQTRPRTPFVGRGTELAKIRGWIDNTSRAVYVFGEPGTGKSRLVAEALLEYPDRYFLFCDPTVRRTFEPVKQLLRQHFAVDPLLDRARNQESFRAQWKELAGDDKELLRIESIVGSLLDYEWEQSIWSVLPDKEKPDQQKNAFATFIATIAAKKPVIIHLDDPQWIDDSSREFLQHLGAKKAAPVTIVATCRYTDDGLMIDLEIPEYDREVLELKKLDTPASETVIRNLVQMDTPPQPTLDWITAKADGNPLFLEQIVAYLRENARLDEAGNLTGDLTQIEAFGIADIIGSRIDALTESVRTTLQHASVLGMEFNVRVLSQMLDRNPEEDLSTGKAARMWFESDDLFFKFTHILIRDTAYNRMMSDRLKPLHLLAAEAMESVYHDDEKALNEHAEELAKHFEKGEAWEKAVEWYDKAGEYADTHFFYNYAAHCFIKGLSSNRKIATEANPKTGQLLEKLSFTYGHMGYYNKEAEYTHHALSFFRKRFGERHVYTATNLSHIACIYTRKKDNDKSLCYHQLALSIIRENVSEVDIKTATCLQNLGNIYITKRDYRLALENHLEAIEIIRASMGERHPRIAYSLKSVGKVYDALGDHDQAHECYNNAYRIYRDYYCEYHHCTADILFLIGLSFMYKCDFEEVDKHFRRVWDILRDTYGPKHPKTTAMLEILEVICSLFRKNPDSAAYYRSLLEKSMSPEPEESQ